MAEGTANVNRWREGGNSRTIPALILATLDLIGLGIASYLSVTELKVLGGDGLPYCGPLHGCQEVAQSQWSRIGPVPVAVFGVFLSITLFILAISWWRTGDYRLLLAHYGLSLVGVLFEGWFQYAQIFLVKAVCVWCEAYGISLILRFVVALVVYLRTPNPTQQPVSNAQPVTLQEDLDS